MFVFTPDATLLRYRAEAANVLNPEDPITRVSSDKDRILSADFLYSTGSLYIPYPSLGSVSDVLA
jgi:hypothetical protein